MDGKSANDAKTITVREPSDPVSEWGRTTLRYTPSPCSSRHPAETVPDSVYVEADGASSVGR
jgi:hypothetical protein